MSAAEGGADGIAAINTIKSIIGIDLKLCQAIRQLAEKVQYRDIQEKL